jgi:hypothetical protein
MSGQTQIEISAQVWVCDACGGQDNKSCGCNSTAHQEELAAKREDARQRKRRSRQKAKQNQQSCHSDADIENIEGNAVDPEASADAMKAKLADDDQTKEPPPTAPAEPSRAEVQKLIRAWVQASPEVKRQFVRERWDEIARVRKQLDANGGAAHEDRWIEGDTL